MSNLNYIESLRAGNVVHPNDILGKNVMRRVRIIFFMRRIKSSLSAKLTVTIMLMVVVSFSVSMPSVVENMAHLAVLDATQRVVVYSKYIAKSFWHTGWVVQFSILWIGATLVASAWDVIRKFRQLKAEKIIPANSLSFLRIRF